MSEYNINLGDTKMICPFAPKDALEQQIFDEYSLRFYEKRQRKGLTLAESRNMMQKRSYYGAMMVDIGHADAMIGGLTRNYPDTVRPALQILGARKGVKKVAGMHILMTKQGPLFMADTTINHHLTYEDIADLTVLVAEQVKTFNIEPVIGLITYSNFGSVQNQESADLMRKATALLHERNPELIVDGEMQAHMALGNDILDQLHPFSKLAGKRANTLIFPNLSSANIAYNLLYQISDIDMIGPIMIGMRKPVHILQLGATVHEIVDMVALAAVHAQEVDE